jgi:hypothetical protein
MSLVAENTSCLGEGFQPTALLLGPAGGKRWLCIWRGGGAEPSGPCVLIPPKELNASQM